jgi:AcrR family transcriptional regulator
MKRGEHHGALRPALIAAGLSLLDAEGIEGVTIRACARAAGVSHAAPVNHFLDRRALLTALAVSCMEELDALTLTKLALASGGPRRQLEALFDLSVRYGLAHPHRYRLMGRADLRDPHDPALAAMLPRLLAPIRNLAAALAAGPERAEGLTTALCAALSGYVFMRIDGNLAGADPLAGSRPGHLELLDILLDGGS